MAHISQKALSQLKPAVQKLHIKLLRKRKLRLFALCDIANVDQTPLPLFKAIEEHMTQRVLKNSFFISGKYDLDERQITIHFTFFDDGIPRPRPAKRSTMQLNILNLHREIVGIPGKVYFQKKTWCDEKLVKKKKRKKKTL